MYNLSLGYISITKDNFPYMKSVPSSQVPAHGAEDRILQIPARGAADRILRVPAHGSEDRILQIPAHGAADRIVL